MRNMSINLLKINLIKKYIYFIKFSNKTSHTHISQLIVTFKAQKKSQKIISKKFNLKKKKQKKEQKKNETQFTFRRNYSSISKFFFSSFLSFLSSFSYFSFFVFSFVFVCDWKSQFFSFDESRNFFFWKWKFFFNCRFLRLMFSTSTFSFDIDRI